MALHLTSLGDQESRGKMPDNCCIYQGNEFIAVEFLQQNKGLHYESTLVILTKVGAGLDSSSGRGRRCFALQWLLPCPTAGNILANGVGCRPSVLPTAGCV